MLMKHYTTWLRWWSFPVEAAFQSHTHTQPLKSSFASFSSFAFCKRPLLEDIIVWFIIIYTSLDITIIKVYHMGLKIFFNETISYHHLAHVLVLKLAQTFLCLHNLVQKYFYQTVVLFCISLSFDTRPLYLLFLKHLCLYPTHSWSLRLTVYRERLGWLLMWHGIKKVPSSSSASTIPFFFLSFIIE